MAERETHTTRRAPHHDDDDEPKTTAKKADAPAADDADPSADPGLMARDQVSVKVDPEMPYVAGQGTDPFAGQRDTAGQIPA